MITKKEYEQARQETLKRFREAGIRVTPEEAEHIEVADFGLSNLPEIGLEILTYVNTEKVCAKEMVLFPGQTCPEHIHVDGPGYEGKEETFRVRRGKVYLYVSGEPTPDIQAKMPPSKVTVFHEIVLTEGQQYTLYPRTLHWFQGGPEGAIVSEFSTRSRDESDIFTDPAISRLPEIGE